MIMQAKRFLVPVDVDKPQGSYDALRFVEGLASEGFALDATLLHVVPLNINWGDRRVYDELGAESESRLRALARRMFEPGRALSCRVRFGRPHEEILAEAREGQAEMIVMTSPKASERGSVGVWKWRFNATTVERVVRAAPCLTLVLPRTWQLTPEQYRRTLRPEPARIPTEFAMLAGV